MFITRVLRRAMYIIPDQRLTGFIRDIAPTAFIRNMDQRPFTGREIDIGAVGKANLLSSAGKGTIEKSFLFTFASSLRPSRLCV